MAVLFERTNKKKSTRLYVYTSKDNSAHANRIKPQLRWPILNKSNNLITNSIALLRIGWNKKFAIFPQIDTHEINNKNNTNTDTNDLHGINIKVVLLVMDSFGNRDGTRAVFAKRVHIIRWFGWGVGHAKINKSMNNSQGCMIHNAQKPHYKQRTKITVKLATCYIRFHPEYMWRVKKAKVFLFQFCG